MTWDEFKKAVEERGVLDDDEIEWINTASSSTLFVERTQGKDGGWYVVISSREIMDAEPYPTLSELRGIAPELTGGRAAEDYVRDIRDEWT